MRGKYSNAANNVNEREKKNRDQENRTEFDESHSFQFAIYFTLRVSNVLFKYLKYTRTMRILILSHREKSLEKGQREIKVTPSEMMNKK